MEGGLGTGTGGGETWRQRWVTSGWWLGPFPVLFPFIVYPLGLPYSFYTVESLCLSLGLLFLAGWWGMS